MRHWPVGHAAIWVPAVRPARARRSARPRTVGHAVTGPAAVARDAMWRDSAWRDGAWRDSAWRDSARGEPAGLARVRASRLAGPLLPRRQIARTTEFVYDHPLGPPRRRPFVTQELVPGGLEVEADDALPDPSSGNPGASARGDRPLLLRSAAPNCRPSAWG